MRLAVLLTNHDSALAEWASFILDNSLPLLAARQHVNRLPSPAYRPRPFASADCSPSFDIVHAAGVAPDRVDRVKGSTMTNATIFIRSFRPAQY